jgi:hypothetical protein
MNPENSNVDADRASSPPLQEVEFALVLQHMITSVEKDPELLRLTIYDFARTKLKNDLSSMDEQERKRLSSALETAIKGVEQFSLRPDNRRLPPPAPPPQIAQKTSTGSRPAQSVAIAPQVEAVSHDVSSADVSSVYETYIRPTPPLLSPHARSVGATLLSFAVGILLAGVIGGGAVYLQRGSLGQTSPATGIQPSSGPIDVKVVSSPPNPLPFPVPTVYGVYALNNGALSELEALPQQVPDKRVAMSTPVTKPSRTVLADGKANFIVFRRDLAGNAPERVDVRVVAQVVRALSFDPKGKAVISPVSDAWNIRNVAHEFRVKPIPGNSEMVLIQPANADFALTPGRYVLALNNQGYDFTVAGKVSDSSQCLERTEAANGTFYSDCEKL